MSDIQHIANCTCGTCKPAKFVQIHCHSSFSNLDGAALTENLVKKAKEYGHPALATTEHGNPAGLYGHYKACKKAEIKPILGLEFYITNDLTARVANKNREFEDRDFHQSVYIKNKQGYKNFNYLTYVSFTDGYYYKPRIDFDLLFSKSEGLMATTSCIASKINNYLTNDRMKDAEELFKRYIKAFGDDFYGEIQFNELNDRSQWGIDQRRNNQFIIDMCKKYDVPIMIGGDVHYLNPEDNVIQDALINSKRQAKEGEEGFQIHARHLYYHDTKDYYEFNQKFGYHYDEKFLEECFENSVKFAEKVDFQFETGKYHVPKINTGSLSEKEYLEKITWEGIERRITKGREQGLEVADWVIEKYEEQIPYELKVIDDLNLNGYLLVVQDIINWEKNNGIFVGPGRGSAAGSIVAYAIGITDMCPVQHKLLFERFINPNRKVMADIDWDSEMGGREQVLEYLIQTYGQNQVLNVATFGTYSPKSALQDMSRGLRKETGMDSILMRKINKIPEIAEEGVNKWKPKPGELIEFFKKIRKESTDKDIMDWIDNNQDTISYADRLQGQMKNLGTHAGGIVVTPEPVYNFIPVTKGSGNLVTAFREADGSSKDLGELGILKLDVLGLKTLNVLKECCKRIKEDLNIDLYEKIYYLPLDDQKMIDAFATGLNFGIFQMDRSAMFTSRFREDGAPVDSFEDIVAINAMNRPGPLEKFLPKYGKWKALDRGLVKYTKEEIEEINKERYPFEFMREALESSHGACLYQEQVMQLVCILTGMSFGEADSFRRAIAWRPDNPKYHTVKDYFDKLEASMLSRGYSKEDADYFLKYLRDMSGYSFNRSHSVVYSYISWQTLYFKVYYPAYFYAAMLNMADKVTEIQDIIDDAKKHDIEILPLSVLKSEFHSKAETEKSIRLGYQLIKGLGESVETELKQLELHKCRTIDEVMQKPFKKINSTHLANLIKLGCFDEFGVDRELIMKLKDLYKEPKIEKWFSRKRSPVEEKTMPEILSETFDVQVVMQKAEEVKELENPHPKLIGALTPFLTVAKADDEEKARIKKQKETIQAETELLGFSISEDEQFTSFIKSMQSANFANFDEYEEAFDETGDTPACYFKVVKIVELKTKTGKPYWQYVLSDGKREIKAKVWRQNSKVKEGDLGIGALELSQWGFTLLKIEVM